MNNGATGAARGNANRECVGSYRDEDTGQTTPIYLDADAAKQFRAQFVARECPQKNASLI